MQANKYYTHFIAGAEGKRPSGEWSAVVELNRPLSEGGAERELSQVLASSLDIQMSDICILDWSRLH
ncbi:MAG TPA: hypothetical protein VMH77_00930 [Steroidobacteraceae bacterium]|nr:hypothetical protein [Steroidobacteraceae bacterium]